MSVGRTAESFDRVPTSCNLVGLLLRRLSEGEWHALSQLLPNYNLASWLDPWVCYLASSGSPSMPTTTLYAPALPSPEYSTQSNKVEALDF